MAMIYQTLLGGDGEDDLAIHGEPQGNNTIFYATIHGGEGNDTITGTSFVQGVTAPLAIYGDGGNDRIIYRGSSTPMSLFGGDGDDSVGFKGYTCTADGGAGYDKLYTEATLLDASKIKNFEELVIAGRTTVEDFDLNIFQKISTDPTAISATLQFNQSVDFGDYTIDTSGKLLNAKGSNFADTFDMRSQSGDFALYGNGGNDIIIAGGDPIYADGGYGSDYVSGSDGNDRLSGNRETIEDGSFDTVLGRGGDDNIVFSVGSARLDGGAGKDTLQIERTREDTTSLAKVTLRNFEIIDFKTDQIAIGAANIAQAEAFKGRAMLLLDRRIVLDDVAILKGSDLTIQGSQNNDVAVFAGSEGKLHFQGENGDDRIQTDGGPAYFWGGDGNDILVGGKSANLLDGGDGDDTIRGGDNRDILISGSGADKISAGGGNDDIRLSIHSTTDGKDVNAGAGNDTITAGTVRAGSHGRLNGGDGTDSLAVAGDLSGYKVANIETLVLRSTLIADADAFDSFNTISTEQTRFNLILSGGGTFTWHGGSKVDDAKLLGSSESDILDFSHAKNSWAIKSGAGNDSIIGTAFADSAEGGAGNDTIYGGGANDNLTGGAGNDFIVGGDGSDTIEGGKGVDILNGGAGNDEITDSSGGGTVNGGAGDDEINVGSGRYVVIGGAGDDFFWGGEHISTYAFGKNSGTDHIDDFNTGYSSHDVIDLSAISSIKNFDDLIKNHVKDVSGTGWFATVIDLGRGNSVRLGDAAVDQLTEDMFIF